ncbi:hypothetical protein BKA62DRAFT_610485 [Auriculariales sp. MPI-PUGE-AT-0066]|nr:hypothetical protein BKA62DRAFT_610485 [Auriculariales sp. MPI-PUGE-AT-0066]
MAPPLIPISPDIDLAAFEHNNVHSVYDTIADHFSSTRYKPWPVIATFVASISAGSIGLDSGCGNGKYLPLNTPSILTLGLDRSANLLRIAQTAGGRSRDVVLGNILDCCWRPGCFDFAISIACLHHLASPERRQQGVQESLRALLQAVSETHGRILFYVWSTEQDEHSKRVVPVHNDTKAQDVLVPWVHSSVVHQRYYHLFEQGELRQLVTSAATALDLQVGPPSGHGKHGVEITQDGWERSNWYIELRRWES